MDPSLQVLHLEDAIRDTELVQASLEEEGIRSELTRVEAEQDFIAALKAGRFDLILADYTLPAFDGLSALKLAQTLAPDVPFLFVSGTLGEDVAIEALKNGATDYVLKTRLARLGPSVTRALREAREKSERNQTQEKLNCEQQRFMDVVNSVDGVVWEANAGTFAFSFVSEQAERIVGYTIERWLTEPTFWKDHLHPEDRDWAVEFRLKATAEKRNHDFEYRMIAADGRTVWFHDVVTVVVEDDRPKKLRGVLVNTTERKRAEEAVRRSEKQLRDLIETIPVMAFSTRPDGSNEFVTRGWVEYSGLSADQTAGSGWEVTLHPDDLEQHRAKWRASWTTGQPFENEARHRDARGNYRWFLVRAVPLRDDQGNILKWYGALTDIEDRKRAEEVVRRSEKELRDVINAVPANIWSASPNGAVDFINQRWQEFTGLLPEDALGWNWEKAIHPDDRTRSLADWREALETGQPMESEIRVQRADGEHCSFFVRNVPLRDEHGKIVKWYGAAIDIEDRKRAEEQVRRSEAYLAEAERLTHTGSWYWNVRTGEVSWSREYCGIFGFDFEKDKPSYPLFIGRVHPEDRPKVEQVLWADVREKRDFDGEYRLLLPDGSIKYLHSLGKCSVGQSGEVEYIGAVVDITERKKAEEALLASEQLARSHVEVMMRSLDVLATEAAPEKFIGEMLRTIGQQLHAIRVWLWLRNQRDDSLDLHLLIENDKQVAPDPEHPFVKDPHAWRKGIAFVQEMLSTKRPVVCNDVDRELRVAPEFRKYITSRGWKRFMTVPMFVSGELRGFIGIQHAEKGTYRGEEIELAQALAHHVMLAVHGAELAEQRRRAVILEERTRMARDIHDTLAQGFTGVIVQLDTAVEALRDEEPEAAAKHIGRARELARESLVEARHSVHALRPQALERAELADALKAIIINTTAGTSLHSDFQLDGEPRKLQPAIEENLLRIGQEALTNALKHACATTFQARLSFDSKVVRLELRDNGKGFTVDNANGDGIGLIGMKERAEQIGGTLAITSEPGAGTTIIAVSPIGSQ